MMYKPFSYPTLFSVLAYLVPYKFPVRAVERILAPLRAGETSKLAGLPEALMTLVG